MACGSNNAYRLSKLLVDGGTYYARELLVATIDKLGFSTLDAFLNDPKNKSELRDLKKKKILRKGQMDILYPQSSHTAQMADLDITLLTCILTNCCNLTATHIAAIDKLREFRNTLHGHSPAFAIDDVKFQQYWVSISNYLINEAQLHLKRECVDHIKDLIKRVEGEVLTHDVGEKYSKLLIDWYNERMSSMRDKIQSMASDIEKLQSMATDIETIKHTLLNQGPQREETTNAQLSSSKVQVPQSESTETLDTLENEENSDTESRNSENQVWLKRKIVEAKREMRYVRGQQRRTRNLNMPTLSEDILEGLKSLLTDERFVVLSGLRGSGKTFLGHSIMIDLISENYTPIIAHIPADLDKAIIEGDRFVFLVDDLFGRNGIDEQELDTWNKYADALSKHINSRESMFIFTIRIQNLKAASNLDIHSKILSRANYEIHDETFIKENLLRFHAKLKRINFRQSDLQRLCEIKANCVGYPLICSHIKGTFDEIEGLFLKPTEIIIKEIDYIYQMKNNAFFVLLLVMMNGNHLNLDKTESSSRLEQDLKEVYAINEPLQRSAFDNIVGTYLLSRESVYSLSHASIIEAVFMVALKYTPRLLITHAPIEYINNHSQLLLQNEENSVVLLQRFFLKHHMEDIAKCNLWTQLSFIKLILRKHGVIFFYTCNMANDKTVFEHVCCSASVHVIKQIIHHESFQGSQERFTDLEQVHTRAMQSVCSLGRTDVLQLLIQEAHFPVKEDLIFHGLESDQRVNTTDFLLQNGGNISARWREPTGENILQYSGSRGYFEVIIFILESYPIEFYYLLNGVKYETILDILENLGSGKHRKRISKLCRGWVGLKQKSMVHTAAEKSSITVLKLLLRRNKAMLAHEDEQGYNALHFAASSGSKVKTEYLIKRGINPNKTTNNGQNILHISASKGCDETLSFLVEKHRGLLKSVCNKGWNALHYSVLGNSPDCFDILTNAGMNIYSCTSDGLNVSHIAARKDKPEILRHILGCEGRLIHIKDKRGMNALHHAALATSKECTCLIIDKGISQYSQTPNGSTILHVAADMENIEFLKYVLTSFPDLKTAVNNNGYNALHYSSRHNSIDCFDCLAISGVHHADTTHDGLNVLHIASSHGKLELLKHILSEHPELRDSSDGRGMQALHHAATAIQGGQECISYLIQAGIKPDLCSTDGSTFLHTAVKHNNIAVVQYAVTCHKALVHTLDGNGQSVYDLAKSKPEIYNLLPKQNDDSPVTNRAFKPDLVTVRRGRVKTCCIM